MAFTLTYHFFNQLTAPLPVTFENEALAGQLISIPISTPFGTANPFEAAYLTPTGFTRLRDVLQLTTVAHRLQNQTAAQWRSLTPTLSTDHWLTTSGRELVLDQPLTKLASPRFVNGPLPIYDVTVATTDEAVADNTVRVPITPGDAQVFELFNTGETLPDNVDLQPLIRSVLRVSQAMAPLFAGKDHALICELNNGHAEDLARTENRLFYALVTNSATSHQLNALTFDAIEANDAYCLELQRRADPSET